MADETKDAATQTTGDTTSTTVVTGSDTKATDTTATTVKADAGYWPTDWQDRVSKGDEKRAAHVKRYSSPEAMADALIAAQNRIRSGELKTALPENPKPEELAAWRKENGIPEAPEKYELKFDNGLVIGDDDKPAIDEFLKAAHQANMAPAQAKAAVEWYYREQQRQAEVQAAKDEQQRIEALDKLNVEWGSQFRTNINRIQNDVLSRFPTDVREAMESARLADGTALFNHPEIIRTFMALANEINPAGVVVPAGGGDMTQSLNDEIKGIEAKMGTKAYIKDEAMQARYRELIDIRGKLQQRAA
jgi:hypothetical protein